MHLILMTRGIQQSRDVWKKFMETQMFNWKRQRLTKKEDGTFERGAWEMTRVQGALRPIELWEYVFPQESLQEVLAMMGQQKNAYHMRPEITNFAWVMRMMMKAKKLPDLGIQDKQTHEITQKFVPMSGMAVYPIGIREDAIADIDFGKEGAWYQEHL